MKRVFAFLMCLCIALTVAPVTKAAESGNVRLYYNYKTTFYDTVEEALAAAKGGTVSLQKDITAGQVVVPQGVTLNLNGYALTADIVVVSGKLADKNGGGGQLFVKRGQMCIFGDNGGKLPVWNPQSGCYQLTSVSYQQLVWVAEDLSSAQYIFVPYVDDAATALLADGSADNGLSVKVRLAWNGGASEQYYTFSDKLVAAVYGGNYAQVFSLKVSGIAAIGDMTACAIIESEAVCSASSEGLKVAPPVKCCVCGAGFTDADRNDICDTCGNAAHVYTLSVTPPTCTEEGYTTYTCHCEYTYVADHVPALGKHTDANKDKLCDVCHISVIVELDFYSVNDLHGAFIDTTGHPGVDEFTTYMKQKYQDDASYEILLSAGDMWQGSVESSTNKGALMTQWMNALDFVSMTIGNHEFDWGSSYIAANAQKAEFPLLGINIQENGKTPDYCQPSTTVERGGVKIGIIGAMGDHVSSISGEFNQNLTFLSGSTLTNLVKNESTRLRQEENCDLIVYVIHSDEEDYDTALSNGYVDLVFEAHTHQSYISTDSYGVTHIQSGGYNEAVSFVNIAYNIAEDTYVVEERKNLSNSVYGASSIADDPIVGQIYKQYFPGDDPYTTILGKNAATRSSGAIGQKVAEQYLAFGQEYWSEYDIVLAGGSLNTRTPYKLYSGNVTYAQLYSLLPFDNSLVLGAISGSKLRQRFINNSSYAMATIDQMPAINNNKTYYIIVDTYTAYYAYNGITIIDRFDNYYARDVLADYIKDGGWSK